MIRLARGTAVVTADYWATRVEQMRVSAVGVVDDKKACLEAWLKSGEAVEYSIKGLIHARAVQAGAFQLWPTKNARPDLHTHNLRDLCAIAGINFQAVPPHIRAAWRTVLDWDRGHAYDMDRVSRKVARSMFDAAFGDDGVIEWLRTL